MKTIVKIAIVLAATIIMGLWIMSLAGCQHKEPDNNYESNGTCEITESIYDPNEISKDSNDTQYGNWSFWYSRPIHVEVDGRKVYNKPYIDTWLDPNEEFVILKAPPGRVYRLNINVPDENDPYTYGDGKTYYLEFDKLYITEH